MDKSEWQSLYDILEPILSDFQIEYSFYQNGKNLKIRNEAKKKVDSAIQRAIFYIKENSEAFLLLTKRGGSSGYGQMDAFNEFKRPNYFGGDLSDFLKDIKTKIKRLEDDL